MVAIRRIATYYTTDQYRIFTFCFTRLIAGIIVFNENRNCEDIKENIQNIIMTTITTNYEYMHETLKHKLFTQDYRFVFQEHDYRITTHSSQSSAI